MIWILIFAIFLALVLYVVVVNDVIERIRRRRGDRAIVAEIGARGSLSRAETLTCPRCRRIFPLVTFLGRTRCPRCGSVVIGWQ